MSPNKLDEETAVYQITIQGHIDKDWSAYFGGLAITPNELPPQTTLSGELTDQAALLGVLNNLYNLGFYILSVQKSQYQTEEHNV